MSAVPQPPSKPPDPQHSDVAVTLGLNELPTDRALAESGGGLLQPGMQFGHFSLLRRIGAGGMGEVWLAQQNEPIERVVALKLVRPEARDALRETLFQIERQALARLEHPSIARVYEAGSAASGAQYFAMEWVDGLRLDHYCRTRKLSLQQICALLIQACRGMQHAHLKGILHRDLKPANLLVRQDGGDEPQLKIIDFGIATTAGAGQWRPAGTEGYMSPEQMRAGEILDPRCDVYALGVVLLELAMHALRIPFSEWWWLDSTARFDALSAPGRHARQARERSLPRLPAELRAVVVRAIHPDREQRYASAEALAGDLRALIERRPVQALPHQRGYLFAKFVQRHRWAVSVSALALGVLFGALWFAWTGWRHAEAANRDAALTAGFLQSILAQVDPERARGLDTTLLRQVLDAAAARSALELVDAPIVRAGVESTIAGTLRSLGEYQRSAELAAQALQAAERALGADSAAALELALQQARALHLSGDSRGARTLSEHYLPRARQLFGLASPAALGWSALLVRLRREQGDIADAVALGAEIQTWLVQHPQERSTADPVRGEVLTETGIAQAALGRFDDALESLRQTVALQSRLHGESSFAAIKARGEWAVVLFMAKRYPEARDAFAAILPEHVRILGPEHPTTLTVRGNVAAALTLSGDPAAAAGVLGEMLVLRERINGPEHPETLTVLGNLAAAQMRAGHFEAAEAAFRRYVELCRRIRDPGHPSCVERLAGLGKVLREQGRFAEAAPLLVQAWRGKRGAEGQQFAPPEQVAAELAELYRRWGKEIEHRQWQERAGERKPAPVVWVQTLPATSPAHPR